MRQSQVSGDREVDPKDINRVPMKHLREACVLAKGSEFQYMPCQREISVVEIDPSGVVLVRKLVDAWILTDTFNVRKQKRAILPVRRCVLLTKRRERRWGPAQQGSNPLLCVHPERAVDICLVHNCLVPVHVVVQPTEAASPA